MSSGKQRDTAPSATKSEALALLAEICALSPDIRLGQLFAHLGFLGEDQTGRTLRNIDDEELLAVLYAHHAELLNRNSGRTQTKNRASKIAFKKVKQPANKTK